MNEVDRYRAAAETGLDRIDDAELRAEPDAEDTAAPETPEAIDSDDYGFHEDDPDADLLTEGLGGDLDDGGDVDGLRDDGESDALDVVAEGFNARDLDRILEVVAIDGEAPGLLGYDRANLPSAIQDLWTRRPTVCMTRGFVDTDHVGVVWEHDGSAWWRVAAVHVDDVVDDRIGVLEFSEDIALLDRVVAEAPDVDELDEGARWVEWDEGVP